MVARAKAPAGLDHLSGRSQSALLEVKRMTKREIADDRARTYRDRAMTQAVNAYGATLTPGALVAAAAQIERFLRAGRIAETAAEKAKR